MEVATVPNPVLSAGVASVTCPAQSLILALSRDGRFKQNEPQVVLPQRLEYKRILGAHARADSTQVRMDTQRSMYTLPVRPIAHSHVTLEGYLVQERDLRIVVSIS